MNIVLWTLQVLLAMLYLAGGAFKALNPEDVAKQIPALSKGGWVALGAFEVLGGLLLLAPVVSPGSGSVIPWVASALALETLALAVLYARYSLKLVPQNPLVYAGVMGLVAVFVAYGRYALSPLT